MINPLFSDLDPARQIALQPLAVVALQPCHATNSLSSTDVS